MLLNNYAVRNANQSRALGGNLDPTYNYNLNRMYTFYVGANNVVNVTDRMSIPAEGYRPPYSLVLAPKEGGMSTYMFGTGTVTNAAQVAGLFASATLTGLGIISNAAMGLTIEMVAAIASTGTLSASVIGQLEAVATLAGSSTVTAAQSALAGLVASLAGTGVISDAQQEALGQMTADIFVNESEATVLQIVSGVWEALASEHDVSGTMGEKLNSAGGAADPWGIDIVSGGYTGNQAGKKLKDASDDAFAASVKP